MPAAARRDRPAPRRSARLSSPAGRRPHPAAAASSTSPRQHRSGRRPGPESDRRADCWNAAGSCRPRRDPLRAIPRRPARPCGPARRRSKCRRPTPGPAAHRTRPRSRGPPFRHTCSHGVDRPGSPRARPRRSSAPPTGRSVRRRTRALSSRQKSLPSVAALAYSVGRGKRNNDRGKQALVSQR